MTHLAAFRWTISILLNVGFKLGIPYITGIQMYSSDGLTNNVAAFSLTGVKSMFKMRRKKPKVLLAYHNYVVVAFPF